MKDLGWPMSNPCWVNVWPEHQHTPLSWRPEWPSQKAAGVYRRDDDKPLYRIKVTLKNV